MSCRQRGSGTGAEETSRLGCAQHCAVRVYTGMQHQSAWQPAAPSCCCFLLHGLALLRLLKPRIDRQYVHTGTWPGIARSYD